MAIINKKDTVPTGPNVTESGPKPDLGFAFRVWLGSAKADPERTPTGHDRTQMKPRADAKRTSKASLNFGNEPVKRIRGPLYVTELLIRIADKLS